VPTASRAIVSLPARSLSTIPLLPTNQSCRPSRASIIAQGTNVTDNRFNWSFDRLLTPTLAFTLDSGRIHRNWPLARSSGFDSTAVGLKTEIYRDNRHEALASAGLQWGIGHSGAAGVEADEPNTVQPGVFFGKGFGDVPASVAWLRPFAVTGAVVYEIPAGGTGATALAPTPSGLLQTVSNPKVDTLHWGLSIQYSTYYLTSRFTGGPPKDEPLNQLVPLVEFAVDNPRTGASVATMNPGFAYVAVTWQIAAEAVLPLNREGGNSVGFRAQLLFFIDDMFPAVFGKPVITDQPDRSLIAWH
jgi:hypothetical protein